jgi:hypothetical protein
VTSERRHPVLHSADAGGGVHRRAVAAVKRHYRAGGVICPGTDGEIMLDRFVDVDVVDALLAVIARAGLSIDDVFEVEVEVERRCCVIGHYLRNASGRRYVIDDGSRSSVATGWTRCVPWTEEP